MGKQNLSDLITEQSAIAGKRRKSPDRMTLDEKKAFICEKRCMIAADFDRKAKEVKASTLSDIEKGIRIASLQGDLDEYCAGCMLNKI
jgi:hypothetical protein